MAEAPTPGNPGHESLWQTVWGTAPDRERPVPSRDQTAASEMPPLVEHPHLRDHRLEELERSLLEARRQIDELRTANEVGFAEIRAALSRLASELQARGYIQSP